MVDKIFENYNVQELIRLRSVLLDDQKREILLEQLDEIFLNEFDSSVTVDKEIKHLLKGFDLEMLYLSSRNQAALISAGCNTIFDITKINNLYNLPHIGDTSIKNIKVNMMFVEKYLFELCNRNRGKEFVMADSYDDKYQIVSKWKSSIFSYLENNGEEFFFANSDKSSVNKCHNVLTRKNNHSKLVLEEYRIMRCLTQYSFLDDLEKVDQYDIDGYKSFDRFITKSKCK